MSDWNNFITYWYRLSMYLEIIIEYPWLPNYIENTIKKRS